MLRVLCQDLLYHEAPVAMSPVVVRKHLRSVVMRRHVQRMMHNLAVRPPQYKYRARAPIIAPFSRPSQLSYSRCRASVVRCSRLRISYPPGRGGGYRAPGARLLCGVPCRLQPRHFCPGLVLLGVPNRERTSDRKIPNPAAFMPTPLLLLRMRVCESE